MTHSLTRQIGHWCQSIDVYMRDTWIYHMSRRSEPMTKTLGPDGAGYMTITGAMYCQERTEKDFVRYAVDVKNS